MKSLDYFDRFVPKAKDEAKANVEVWSYSRVSSKEQFENNSSVSRQIEANDTYALTHGLTVVERFGGTYESAKSDFTRKEFTRLIERVKVSRRKPYAILVYKMSRFSRSGGNAIGLVNSLVEEQGVHLIEVSSGLSTTTDRGKVAIYESLFHAHKENLERKEIIIPNMKAYLRKGNRFGSSPTGYDHYGPRVSDGRFLAKEQRIVVNHDGKILKDAWGWKLSGRYSDAQIIVKMQARGLTMLKQQVSAMWRNPFYCGILINKLAGEPVRGNWEAIVSMEDFMKVQQLLEGNQSGYQHRKDEDLRPLTRSLKCSHCLRYMVGYHNKKKDLHYYRCLQCNGVSLSARTTPKGRKKSAEQLLIELLDQYRLPEGIQPLVELQIKKLFDHFNQDMGSKGGELQNQRTTFQNQLTSLKIRRGLGQIDQETFDLTKAHILSQLQQIDKEIGEELPKISNLEELVSSSLQKVQNLSKIWGSSELRERRVFQKTLFPEGILFDAQKHRYLTQNANQFIELIQSVSEGYEKKRKVTFPNFEEKSPSVPRSRLELPTFGL
jgi:site-specific DNA recombinase